MVGAAFLGALAHEAAHWLVWHCTGRQPTLDLWLLEVQPRAGPRHTTLGDRVAAAAPYVCGVAAIVGGWVTTAVLPIVFGLAMIQIPSRIDLATLLGRVEWRFDG